VFGGVPAPGCLPVCASRARPGSVQRLPPTTGQNRRIIEAAVNNGVKCGKNYFGSERKRWRFCLAVEKKLCLPVPVVWVGSELICVPPLCNRVPCSMLSVEEYRGMPRFVAWRSLCWSMDFELVEQHGVMGSVEG